MSYDNECFNDGYSSACAMLIRTRFNLTQQTFEYVQERIKALVEQNQMSTFNIAMGCYARGQRLPSGISCAPCVSCRQYQSSEICDLFCSKPPIVPAAATQHYAPLIAIHTKMPSTTAKTQEPSTIAQIQTTRHSKDEHLLLMQDRSKKSVLPLPLEWVSWKIIILLAIVVFALVAIFGIWTGVIIWIFKNSRYCSCSYCNSCTF